MSFLWDLPVVGEFFKLIEAKKQFKEISACHNMSEKELLQYRLMKLKQLIQHAYENVPLYREKYDAAGVKPTDLKTLQDLEKFPVVTKDDFRGGYPHKTVAKGYKEEDCHLVGTSGSTGSPVKILFDRKKGFYEIVLMSKLSMKLHLNKDFEEGMSILVLDEDAMEILSAKEFKKGQKALYDALEEPVNQLNKINEMKPDYLVSYPSVLKNIAIKVQNEGLKVHAPQVIFTSGESLDASTRDLIEKSFNCEVFDVYVGTEAGVMAIECQEHKGMHVVSYKEIMEILDDNNTPVPDGEIGNVVVTDLTNYATPIIRYSGMGDMSSYSKATCGCPLSKYKMLNRIEGRKVDTILLAKNRVVHPFKLTLAMQGIPGVHKFQIRQEKLDEFKVLVVKEEHKNDRSPEYSFTKACIAHKTIQKKFKKILNDDVTISIDVVNDIPRKKGSHKYQTVVSMANNA